MIDSLPLLSRAEAAAKPFCFCVHDVFKPGVGTAGASVSVSGYLDAGTIVPGARVQLLHCTVVPKSSILKESVMFA